MTPSSILSMNILDFPQRHGFMISETKIINICNTKTFTTIAAVSTKGVPDQVKFTHETKFEFTVNQILLTEFLTDLQNPLIITSMNNNQTWE